MQNTKKSSHVYDYAIIGSGLSGLAIAAALSKETSNVILIESAESFGGQNRSIQTQLGPMNNGLRFLPSTELSKKAVSFLESLLSTDLSATEVENPPMTYDASGLKPFLGFGSHPPEFYDELSYFFAPKRLKTLLDPHEWTQILFNQFRGDFAPRSYVTKFNATEGGIQSLTVNGQKTILAMNFIYTGPVKHLQTLLPADGLSARTRQKLGKAQFWTAVCLDILHTRKVTDSDAIHVLNGTTQDEFGPCAGSFLPAVEVDGQYSQYSQWISFIDDQDSENEELIGQALKKIKRQIKRAYPEALDGVKFERILVVPSFSGQGELKLNSNQSLPAYPNFWVATPAMHKQQNILGALLQAELITSALGCNPLGASIQTQLETDESLAPDQENSETQAEADL